MRRVEVREKKADCDGFDAGVAQRDRRVAHPLFVQWLEFLPVRRREAPSDHHAIAAFDQRTVLPRQLLSDRVVLDPLMTPDMQDVAKALVGDHASFGALVLEHRVGRGRRRMEDEINLVGLALSRRKEALDPLHDSVRGILRRGRNLVDGHRAGVEVGINEIGERAADIDANDFHGKRTPKVRLALFRTGRQMPRASSMETKISARAVSNRIHSQIC